MSEQGVAMNGPAVQFSRRGFLRLSAASLAGAATLRGGLSQMPAMAANTEGYRALVCVMLLGGMDGHDTVLPFDQPSYDQYATVRRDLLAGYAAADGSRARARLLELTPSNAADFGGRAFALPQQLSGVHGLFQSGRAAIVANVGPLIRPLSRTQFENGGVPTPPQLFSHNDQQSIWLASSPEGAQTGWGGGLADAVVGQAAGLARPFTAVSAAGNAVFLSGEAVQPYELSTDGPSTVAQATGAELFGSATLPPLIDQHLRNIGGNTTNLFERDLIDLVGRSIDVNESLAGFFDLPVAYSTPFPGTPLGRQLSVIARMISLRGNLQASRQVFFAAVGDFDTHDRQVGRLPELHVEMDAAFMAFQSAMEEIGEAANVTLFTASDFGRTLTVNGDGTDHGWGSPQLVIGGAVNGGAIVGAMPPFDLGHDVDAGRGRLIPTASVDQYAATLGRWFGLNDAELARVLPNLASFPESNLGFV